jgi:hypothetical protein
MTLPNSIPKWQSGGDLLEMVPQQFGIFAGATSVHVGWLSWYWRADGSADVVFACN